MLWTLLILLAPLWLGILWRLWGWHRRRGAARPTRAQTWPDVVLVGGAQPRGQAALVPDQTELGAELVVNGERWIVSDLDRVATSTRAWLVHVNDRDRQRLLEDERAQLAEAFEVEVQALVVEAVTPLYGVPDSADLEGIANHWVRQALASAVASLRWVNHGIGTMDDLPDSSVWPRIRIVRGKETAHIRWSVKEMAAAMAGIAQAHRR